MSDRRKCDIVMQGGVTSGVVYPGLVCKLAEHYDYQNIGGTSAGAIAASLTAAAEFARRKGNPNAFDAVAKVPAWLGGNSQFGSGSNLFALFQPQPQTAGLFKFATAFLVANWARRIFAWLTLFWKEILLGALPAVLLGFLALHPHGRAFAAHAHGLRFAARAHHWRWRLAAIVLLTLLLAATGIAVAAAVGITARLSSLSKYFFGLCTGYRTPDAKKAPTLIEWLNGQINTIAGKPATEPLTFGDLRRAGICLRMMTTCLTWGRPFTLPFTTEAFYFSPSELRNFFPGEVVTWMEQHPPANLKPTHEPVDTAGLCPLPDSDDLPVIVAARFSLSFPFLFCTVPLYAVDFTLRRRTPDEPVPPAAPGGSIPPLPAPRIPEHVWFTDGGICNNFPLHLFDGPVPRWPTFGIDLTDLRPDRAAEGRTWMPKSNSADLLPDWTRLDAKRGLAATATLISSIVDAARNWVNSLQAIVPGYRDRIVHIALSPDEGGLNLSMPPNILSSLAGYGTQAAQDLIDHFILGTDNGKPTPMTWDNQRWIRYRSTVALLETFLAKFAYSMSNPEPGDMPYAQLVARQPHDPPPTGYRFTPEQTPIAIDETAKLIAIGEAMKDGQLQPGSPKPQPALVIRPNF